MVTVEERLRSDEKGKRRVMRNEARAAAPNRREQLPSAAYAHPLACSAAFSIGSPTSWPST
jgi:hypothetical protein